MKKLSWKNIVTGKLAAAACGAGLFLFTLPANAGLINFDTLDPFGESQIPAGYSNLIWDNFYTLNGATEPNSGYQKGVKSKNNVAYNGNADPAEIFVESGSFTPVLSYMTAAWNDNLKVTVVGYLKGKQVFSRTYTLSTSKPTLVVFGVRVDELDFTSFGGTHHNGFEGSGAHFAMDNLLVMP